MSSSDWRRKKPYIVKQVCFLYLFVRNTQRQSNSKAPKTHKNRETQKTEQKLRDEEIWRCREEKGSKIFSCYPKRLKRSQLRYPTKGFFSFSRFLCDLGFHAYIYVCVYMYMLYEFGKKNGNGCSLFSFIVAYLM